MTPHSADSGGDPLPRRRPRAANSASAEGARDARKRAVCGSITAFVSACGVPHTRTIVWQTAWCTAIPALPDAMPAKQRAQRQPLAVLAQPVRDQAPPRAAQPRR